MKNKSRILVKKKSDQRLLGRRGHKWENYIKMYLRDK
jgi:hypothetical protein